LSIRPLRLPRDLGALAEMLPQTFLYPDHPEWSLQSDETAELTNMFGVFRRLWPLFRVVHALIPSFRDGIRGFVTEEDEHLAAAVLYHRMGATDVWDISTVGVLPGFRRRGLARQLVERAITDIRERGGKRIVLGVIEGNVPARSLYRNLGFEDFGGFVKYELPSAPASLDGSLPEGYTPTPLRRFDWRTRYEFAKRITPASTTSYDPVTVGKYKDPWIARPLVMILLAVRRTAERDLVVHSASGDVAATYGHTVPMRGPGITRIRVRLDPQHAILAEHLVRRALREAATFRPDLRVEISISHWMEDVIAAAESAGMALRVDNRKMGLRLE